jgi:hypothetical protein
MKTVMIIDKNEEFTNHVKKSIKGENIFVFTAETNRDALKHLTEVGDVDLFLIPAYSKDNKKGYFAYKPTDSLSSPLKTDRQLFFQESSPNELKTMLKNNLFNQAVSGTLEEL